MPRRAGINSFGMGGTNVHLILEEAPEREVSPSTREWHLIVLSAKSASALERMSENLAVYLEQHPDVDLADVAYTLQTGRARFKHRRFVVARSHADAIEQLRAEQTLFAENQELHANRTVRFTIEGQCERGSETKTGDLKLSIDTDPAALKALLEQVGELWQLGASVDWVSFYDEEKRCRVPLPTYPFERKKLTLESTSMLVTE
jgi:polyketide synthase PksN